jgi:hypothetical protein
VAAVSRARVTVPISPGELVDKITILEIKAARIRDPAKRRHVDHELALLAGARDAQLSAGPELAVLTAELKAVNERLWDIEDAIRDCEGRGEFGPAFVALARSVYKNNDQRSDLKRRINALTGSDLVEAKEYTAY